ncbi:MAG: cyclodeaminase/cyclohydrolase family protein [Nocardioides sp.]
MSHRFTDQPLGEFLDSLAARSPAPGGGAAAAVTVAIAAGLVAMAAGYADRVPDDLLERARGCQSRAAGLAEEDAAAYTEVLAARGSGDQARLGEAWRRASSVPMELAECGATVVADAVTVAERGRHALRGDAFTGALLANAGVQAAVALVGINAAEAAPDPGLVARALRVAADADAAVRRLTDRDLA